MCFFCFKQKTAYEMRISDWSSDVCSSDLCAGKDAARRADEAGVGEGALHAQPSTPRARRVRTSRHAIRTATPISTCSVIAECSGWSATFDAISTPRFIGPGCITSASGRSEEHTSELQSLMRISYAVFCLKKKKNKKTMTR